MVYGDRRLYRSTHGTFEEYCKDRFGQYRVLFLAESEEHLLAQIRDVPVVEYNAQRRRLAIAEAPRQHKRRLHRHPISTIQGLVNQHQELLSVIESQALAYQLDS